MLEHEVAKAIMMLSLPQSEFRECGIFGTVELMEGVHIDDLGFDLWVPLATPEALGALSRVPVAFHADWIGSSFSATFSATLPLMSTVNGTISAVLNGIAFSADFSADIALSVVVGESIRTVDVRVERSTETDGEYKLAMASLEASLGMHIVPGSFSAVRIDIDFGSESTLGAFLEGVIETTIRSTIASDRFDSLMTGQFETVANNTLNTTAVPALSSALMDLLDTFSVAIPGANMWCPLIGGCTGKVGDLYARASAFIRGVLAGVWAIAGASWICLCAARGGKCGRNTRPPSSSGVAGVAMTGIGVAMSGIGTISHGVTDAVSVSDLGL